MNDSQMTLYFMRHGQTEYNRLHRLQGRLDTHLSPEGVQQGKEAAGELKENNITFSAVYSSPLKRAVETAEIVSGVDRSRFVIDDRLIEVAFGPFEGVKAEELEPDMLRFFRDPAHYEAPEGAESYDHVMRRAEDFLSSMLREKPQGNILVLSHGAAIHAIYAQLCGLTLDHYWDMTLGNCGFFTAGAVNGKLAVTGRYFREANKTIPFKNA